MAWPNDLSRISTNVSTEELNLVMLAIDQKLVEWSDDRTLFIGLGRYQFEFCGKKYEMTEHYEVVTSIERIENES